MIEGSHGIRTNALLPGATELAEIRARLELALAEAETGKFAEGSGEAAVRRAFERARDASTS